MEKNLDEKIFFKDQEYLGRIVHFDNREMECHEELLMYEDSLGDALEQYVIGTEDDTDEYFEEANSIYDRIFCFVPKHILVQPDDKVIEWCYENNIDL